MVSGSLCCGDCMLWMESYSLGSQFGSGICVFSLLSSICISIGLYSDV